MDLATMFVAILILIALLLDQLMKWASQPRKRFPWCRRCGCHMYATPLAQSSIPIEIGDHLVRHNLPYLAVNRYICPRGHCQMWFVPQLGTAESKMVVRDM